MGRSFLSFIIGTGLLLAMVSGTHQVDAQEAPAQRKKVAITQINEIRALNQSREGVEEQLKEAGYHVGENIDIIYKNAQGNVTTAAQIAQWFESMQVDVVVAISTTSAQTVLANVKNAPIVFVSVTAPKEAKLVNDLEQPEGRVTGVSNAIAFEPQLKVMQEMIPDLKTIGVIYDPGEVNSVVLLEQMREVAKKNGIQIVESAASKTSEVVGAAQSLADKVQAYFVNNTNTALAAFESIVQVAARAKKPVFASDLECIDQGAVAVLGPNQKQIGYQAGRMVVQILNGIPTQLIPVGFPEGIELHLNERAARRVGLVISADVRRRAQRIVE